MQSVSRCGTAPLPCSCRSCQAPARAARRLVSEDDPWAEDATFLAEVMLATYERRKPHAEVVNEMPLYPTEAVLFDENQVPSVHFTGARPVARRPCRPLRPRRCLAAC